MSGPGAGHIRHYSLESAKESDKSGRLENREA
jgi:hypothetical protein